MAEGRLVVTPGDVRTMGQRVDALRDAVAAVRPDDPLTWVADAMPGGALAAAGQAAARDWRAGLADLAAALAALGLALGAGATGYETTERAIADGMTGA